MEQDHTQGFSCFSDSLPQIHSTFIRQAYGILDTMLLLQPDELRLGDPLRWWGVCLATSDLHTYCIRCILLFIDSIRDDHLRGALICIVIAVYFSSSSSWCIVSLLVASTYVFDKKVQQAGWVEISGLLHLHPLYNHYSACVNTPALQEFPLILGGLTLLWIYCRISSVLTVFAGILGLFQQFSILLDGL